MMERGSFRWGYRAAVSFVNFLPLARQPGKASLGWINVSLTVIIMSCVVIVLGEAVRRAWRVLAQGRYTLAGREVAIGTPGFEPPEFGEA
jgi:hypothetical protein